MCEVEIVVRRAREQDLPARLALLAACDADSHTDAFLYFFFQELTLQVIVLCGAVLFIFCGVSAPACLWLLPITAIVVAFAVRLHSSAHAQEYARKLRSEEDGWVAEMHGPLAPPAPPRAVPRLLRHDQRAPRRPAHAHAQVVGTVSVWAERGGSGAEGRLGALGVASRWRRAGVGSALLGAARAGAAARGRAALHAATSHLQPAARALLHQLGWECRGTYHRPLLGEALTLPMAHLALELPHA